MEGSSKSHPKMTESLAARNDTSEVTLEELQRFELMRLYTVITSFTENKLEHDIKKQKNEIIVVLMSDSGSVPAESGSHQTPELPAD